MRCMLPSKKLCSIIFSFGPTIVIHNTIFLTFTCVISSVECVSRQTGTVVGTYCVAAVVTTPTILILTLINI